MKLTPRETHDLVVSAYHEHHARCPRCRKRCGCPACREVPCVLCPRGQRLYDLAAETDPGDPE